RERRRRESRAPKCKEAGPRKEPAPKKSPRRPSTLLVASIRLEVTHLVEPAFFLLLRFAGHPLPLLDQLADLLSALVADLRVELGTSRGADRLAALLADLLVELVPPLGLDRLAALAADLLVERPAALLGDLHAALAPGLCNGHPALLLVCHPCLRWLEGTPLPAPFG